MEGEGQDNGRQTRGRRSGKRPSQMKFMFIDSTSHGQNAKPDKAVRSFVMHQARRAKPWSTRQKNSQSPRTATPALSPQSAGPQRSPSLQSDGRAEDSASSLGFTPHQELDSKPTVWNDHSLGSPVSSTSTNSRANSLPCLTPTSSHGSVCDLPYCMGQSCGQVHATQTESQALMRQNGFALGVIDPFDSMAVQMDAKTSSLVDHCK